MPVLGDLSNAAMPVPDDLSTALRELSPSSSEADRLSVCQRIREVARQCTTKGTGSSDRSWTEPARLAVLKLSHEDASHAVRVAAQDARIALEACVRDEPAWGSPAGAAASWSRACVVPAAAMAPGSPSQDGRAMSMDAHPVFSAAIDAPMVDAASAAAVTAAYPLSLVDVPAPAAARAAIAATLYTPAPGASACLEERFGDVAGGSHPPGYAFGGGESGGGGGGAGGSVGRIVGRTEHVRQPSQKRNSPGEGVVSASSGAAGTDGGEGGNGEGENGYGGNGYGRNGEGGNGGGGNGGGAGDGQVCDGGGGGGAGDGGGGKKARGCTETRVYEALVGLRKEAARASKKPTYTVFHDAALREVARALPRSVEELLQIKGIGPVKARDYGEQILSLIQRIAPAATQPAATLQPRTSGHTQPSPPLPPPPMAVEHPFTAPPPAGEAPAAAPPPAVLNAEQRRALDCVMRGESVFITGGAGVGKSFTLNQVVSQLRREHGDERVCVTASTGIAACHIGGTTLHSFAGVGLGKEPVDVLAGRVRSNKKSSTRWEQCKVLVIDEVSMIDGHFFDKMEALARKVIAGSKKDYGRAHLPFGGIQLVLCGDFFQLPPVGLNNGQATFLFEAACWPTVVKSTIVLTQVFRQKEGAFVRLLNEMRRGELSPFHQSLLARLAYNTELEAHAEQQRERQRTVTAYQAHLEQQAILAGQTEHSQPPPQPRAVCENAEQPAQPLQLPQPQLAQAQGPPQTNTHTRTPCANAPAAPPQHEAVSGVAQEAAPQSSALAQDFTPPGVARAAPPCQQAVPGQQALGRDDTCQTASGPASAPAGMDQTIASPQAPGGHDTAPTPGTAAAPTPGTASAPSSVMVMVVPSSQVPAHEGAPLPPQEQNSEPQPSQPQPLHVQPSQPAGGLAFQAVPPVAQEGNALRRATRLYALNEQANNENAKQLEGIAGKTFVYRARDGGQQNHLRMLQEHCIVPTELVLKIGAQVLLCKNLDPARRLVNGSRGRVIGFRPGNPPIDVESAPTEIPGGGIVSYEEFERAAARGDKRPVALQPMRVYPIVDFDTGQGGIVRTTVFPDTWSVESGGAILAYRRQVPLKLAWAISIHKSQGMTLSDVAIDLARCFETGHAYVALSRATDLQRCSLLSFDPSKVRAHPKVRAFYDTIEAASAAAGARPSGGGRGGGSGGRGGGGAPDGRAAGGGAVPAPGGGGLSYDQKKRMEENRAKALARRAQQEHGRG